MPSYLENPALFMYDQGGMEEIYTKEELRMRLESNATHMPEWRNRWLKGVARHARGVDNTIIYFYYGVPVFQRGVFETRLVEVVVCKIVPVTKFYPSGFYP